jgi:hypothetical protein
MTYNCISTKMAEVEKHSISNVGKEEEHLHSSYATIKV